MSNPASPSQTLREQILAEWHALDTVDDEVPFIARLADRLASLEQRNADLEQWQQSAEAIAREFMDDGSSFGPDEYRTVSIGDVAALVLPFQAQVASLEQAQQALRAQIQQVIEKWRDEVKAYPVALDERAHVAAVAVRLCADELTDALSTILTSQEKADQGSCSDTEARNTADRNGLKVEKSL